MASTSAMFSGLSGLSSNARNLEVIGNNIANVNTTAFKSNRLLFSSQLNRNFSLGSSPSGSNGGSNPGQIGLGVAVGATQRNFKNGGMSNTGISSDLAIEGDGFFIVRDAGDQMYTRDGSFQFNAANDLVTPSGARVQGYPVDENFNVLEGQLTDLNIPMGVLTIAEATTNVDFSGNLNADGDLPTTGSVFTFGQLDSIAGAGPIAADTNLLTDLDDGTGNPIFAAGDTISLSGIERGGKVAPDATYTVTATSTVADVMSFLQRATGVVPGAQAGDSAGWTLAGGVLSFQGNFGELNDLSIEPENITVNTASGAPNPFVPTKTTDATGESVRTTFVVYDSLGTPINVDLTMVLNQKDTTGTHWRSFLHSADDTDFALHLESGERDPVTGAVTSGTDAVPVFSFDSFGALSTTTPVSVQMDRDSTGAADPLEFTLSFDAEGSNVTALSDPEGEEGPSTLAATFQNGSPLGVLSSFSVGQDGMITGGFTNGLTRTIGQVAVASFTNPEGLVDAGTNTFSVGPNSGTPLVTTPLQFGTGRVLGGTLELSNVDLSQEFTNMILTSTGYSASSRVITTSDQLIQQLLLLGR